MTQHTFLFVPRSWIARGKYWDEKDVKYPVKGKSEILHLEDRWVNKGSMTVEGDLSVEFVNEYQIAPFADGANTTQWVSNNPTLGRLVGSFTIVDDVILSHLRSADGKFSGSEFFRHETDAKYHVRGALYRGNRRLSSWSVTLELKPGQIAPEEID